MKAVQSIIRRHFDEVALVEAHELGEEGLDVEDWPVAALQVLEHTRCTAGLAVAGWGLTVRRCSKKAALWMTSTCSCASRLRMSSIVMLCVVSRKP